MLVIRLARHGRKKIAFYHLVVAEKSQPVKKKFIAKLGYYDPLANEGKGSLVFDEALAEKYIDNGAQVSQTAARLLTKSGFKKAGKFVQARVSKPKKEAPKPEVKEEEETPIENQEKTSKNTEDENKTEAA
ncbi:MAG TPA: 30S ribosomal protein S16 [Candidatus Gracilibacteria bacterium]